MEPHDFDPGRILTVLIDHGVQFVVIGGQAAYAHGSPIPTDDVDVTPEVTHDNLVRLSAALTTLQARIRTDAVQEGVPFDHDAESLAAATVWNVVTPHGPLDISMTPSGTRGYGDLSRDAESHVAFGVLIRVASLADVIRSKQAANRTKDQRVLPVLREILANRDTGGG